MRKGEATDTGGRIYLQKVLGFPYFLNLEIYTDYWLGNKLYFNKNS